MPCIVTACLEHKSLSGDCANAVPVEASTATPPVANGHSAEAANDSLKELVALNPRKKEKFRLIEKRELSHNVRLFRFELQSPQHKLGLPCGKHVYIYGK